MFSQVSVILFTGGGTVSQHVLGQTPLLGRSPLAKHPTPPPLGRHPPLPAKCMLGYTPPAQCTLGYMPPPAATAADGTHPTGMHSC